MKKNVVFNHCHIYKRDLLISISNLIINITDLLFRFCTFVDSSLLAVNIMTNTHLNKVFLVFFKFQIKVETAEPTVATFFVGYKTII